MTQHHPSLSLSFERVISHDFIERGNVISGINLVQTLKTEMYDQRCQKKTGQSLATSEVLQGKLTYDH